MRLGVACFLGFWLCVVVAADLGARYRVENGTLLNDLRFTPGGMLSSDTATICKRGYASTVRSVSAKVKRTVFEEYGVVEDRAHPYEVDHLISLELGGSNVVANLWPQPYFGSLNAHDKDRLENRLHELVCAGSVELDSAQIWIASDWVEAWRRFVK